MINQIFVLPAGNALRVILTPPAGTTEWRLLRRVDANFTTYNDSTSVLVEDTTDGLTVQQEVLDTGSLVNGTLYYYAVFYYDGAAWTQSSVVTATPEATYSDRSVDVLSIVVDRLTLGLVVEVAKANLKPNTSSVKVFNAPPPFENTKFPVVTVHIDQDGPADRFLGEEAQMDQFSGGSWETAEGWLSRWSLSIIGWSENADERIALRKSLKAILLANLPIFDGLGMMTVEFDFSDNEDLTTYPGPMYQVMGKFTCVAPSYISSTAPAITDVTTTMNAEVVHA